MDNFTAFRQANSRWMGAQFIARFDAVRALVTVLREEISIPPVPLSRSALRAYHNSYTLYTYLFQGLSSSLRAVNNPTGLILARERRLEVFERASQCGDSILAGLSDKDTPFNQKARLADISGNVAVQLGHYERHTTALIQRLGLCHQLEHCPGELRRLFALDDSCYPIPVKRTWVEEQMAARQFPLPANFHRGFLRTELLLRGCPPQSTDARLGHANRGESPFATHSTFDLRLDRKVIRDHLDRLHDLLGLAPVRSRLVPDATPDTPANWASPFADTEPGLVRAALAPSADPPKEERTANPKLEAAWTLARRNATDDDKREINALRTFLRTCENPHARVLSDRPPETPSERPDAASAADLEKQILLRLAQQKIRLDSVASWLRLLGRVIRTLSPDNSEIFPTRLAAFVRDRTSPFSPRLTDAIPVVDLWRDAFEKWLESAPYDRSSFEPSTWAAAIAFAAIVFGCLLDKRKVSMLLHELRPTGKPRTFHATNTYAFLEFDVPTNTAGIAQMNRWFPDPLTELLLLRVPALTCSLRLGDLDQPLRHLFRSVAVPARICPTSWSQVIRMAGTWWSAHGVQADIAAAKRTYCTHGIDRDSWARSFGVEILTAKPDDSTLVDSHAQSPDGEEARVDDDADPDGVASGDQLVERLDTLDEDLRVLHPWFDAAMAILRDTEPNAIPAQINALRTAQASSAAQLYLAWLHALLTERRERRGPMSTTGAQRVFLQAVPALLIVLDDRDPRVLPAEELIWAYTQAIEEADPTLPGRLLGVRLRQFHDHLSEHHGVEPLPCPDSVFGSCLVPWEVDAHVISEDELAVVLHWLATQGRPVMTERDRRIIRLIIILTYRAGVRPHELFGALRGDLHILRGIFLLIRPRPNHGLKSRSATRTLPLAHLLSASERRELLAWISRESAEETHPGRTQSIGPLLFEPEPSCNATTFRSRIVALLNQTLCLALNAPFLHLYHLRHSFATWTHLALVAADHPLIFEILGASPKTVARLRSGKRLRRVFLGKCCAADSRYGFALARTLGHLSPTTSQMHYVHGNDLKLANLVYTMASGIRPAALIAASGIPRSTGFAALADGPHRLVLAARRAHGWCTEAWKRTGSEGSSAQAAVKPKVGSALVSRVLGAYIDSAEPLDIIGDRMGLHAAQVATIIETAVNVAGKTGEPLREPLLRLAAPVPCPLEKGMSPEERRILDELESRLLAHYRAAPSHCLAGIELHLNHFNRQQKDVVFRNPRELKTYVRFLTLLGVRSGEVKLVTRQRSGELPTAPEWSNQSLGMYGVSQVTRITPPNPNAYVVSRKPIGIMFVDTVGQGIGTIVARRFLLVRCAIAAIECR